MPPSMRDMELKLDELYGTAQYTEHLDMIKELGYKVLRNSNGKHKLQMNMEYLKQAFGGVFSDLF